MIPQHMPPATNSAPPQFEEADISAITPVHTSGVRHNTNVNERQRIADALVNEAIRELRAGKRPEELAVRYGMAHVASALERIATEAPTRQQVFAARQQRTQVVNKQFGKEAHQAGIELHQHSDADFKHTLITALDMFEEHEKVSVSAALARAFPDSPGKAQSIGNARNHRRFRKTMLSEDVQRHPALANVLRASTREYNRCAKGQLFRDAMGFLLDRARLHKHIAVLEESCAEHARRILELEARVTLLEAAVAQTKARKGLDDMGATTPKEKVLHLFSSGCSRREIAEHLGMEYDTVKKIIQREQRG
jgi:DNA-binding NarL/FixJ family response regulator